MRVFVCVCVRSWLSIFFHVGIFKSNNRTVYKSAQCQFYFIDKIQQNDDDRNQMRDDDMMEHMLTLARGFLLSSHLFIHDIIMIFYSSHMHLKLWVFQLNAWSMLWINCIISNMRFFLSFSISFDQRYENYKSDISFIYATMNGLVVILG